MVGTTNHNRKAVVMDLKKTRISVCILAVVTLAFSYSYTAYGLMTGDNTLAVSPYFYGNNSGSFGSRLNLAYGVSDDFDIWISYAQDNDGFYGESNFSAMARYNLGCSFIIAAEANPENASIQNHFIWENYWFAIQSNLSVVLDYKKFRDFSVHGVVSPVFKLGITGLDIYCEVSPGYYSSQSVINSYPRTKGFGLDLTVGLGVTIKDVLLSIAMPVYDITNDPKPSLGAWIFFAITSKQ